MITTCHLIYRMFKSHLNCNSYLEINNGRSYHSNNDHYYMVRVIMIITTFEDHSITGN